MDSSGIAEGMRVLLIDGDEGRSSVIQNALATAGHRIVGRDRTTHALHEDVRRLQPDVIVVQTASPDAEMLGHIALLSERMPRPVVVFTGEDDRRVIREAVRAGVTAYVVDGRAAERIDAILQVAAARFEMYQRVRAERDQAQAKLAERKQIERAKGILMRKRGIGEDEAYHTLRRIAMEKNLRMSEVAERLISMSDLLG